MIARHYKDLDAWQLARELERMVFAFIAQPPASRDVDFCRQIRRSASSAPRNIAEGFGRFLPGDLAKFVRTARGSLVETQDHLEAARERGYLADKQHVEMIRLVHRALGASTNFIVYLDKAAVEWRKEGRRRPKTHRPPER